MKMTRPPDIEDGLPRGPRDPALQTFYRNLSQVVNVLSLPEPGGRFQLLQVIGEGTYGEVYAAHDTATGRVVAIKIMENISDNKEEMEEEYRVLRDLGNHPNLPNYYGAFFKPASNKRREDDQVWFVMELCSGGSVTDLVQTLRRNGRLLPEPIIAYILRETLEALVYLHNNHCMHRDIKGHNVLLTEAGAVKLVDFGVSSHLKETLARRNTSVGTPYWMAPEVVACERQADLSYDIRCDVWSLGITALELAQGEPPLSHLHPMRALFQIPRNPPPRLKAPQEWSPAFNNFVQNCLVKNFEERSFVRDLLRHPFVRLDEASVRQIRSELVRLLKEQRHWCAGVKRAPEVTTKHGQLRADRKSKPEPILVDDLALMDHLAEETILDQLGRRYKRGQIYTYIGDILLALNPFQQLSIYSADVSARYRNCGRADNPPHIFAVGDSAFHSMLHQRRNQVIVISGESGAGKTESANFLLRQMVSLGKTSNGNMEVEKILQVNPIMEAFGNARTGINHNSSRFGKFLDLTFSSTSGRVLGAKLSVYLLEQSRVVRQASGERNFHIFYYLYDGLAAQNLLEAYYLEPATYKRNHRYLQGAIPPDRETGVLHTRRLAAVKQGFELLGFRVTEIDTIYRILASIIHLGDVEIRPTETSFQTAGCIIVNAEKIPQIAKLLGLEPADLLKALSTSSINMRGEIIIRPSTAQEAETSKDAMAKALYGRLFDWIVNQINRDLGYKHSCPPENHSDKSIALLDIFGYENFERNSFEQLCINIANEQIQYYFNKHVFSLEQQEYANEGLNLNSVSFSDNRPVLDMFLSRPIGLLALLDEESNFPKATDQSLIDKFHTNIKSSHYLRPKSSRTLQFAVLHYAGPVTYDARSFLKKNRNHLPTCLIQLLSRSSLSVLSALFPVSTTFLNTPINVGDPKQSKAIQTMGGYFRYSLMSLLQKMISGSPHFVRCIKPNEQRTPMRLQKDKVLNQLRCTGVLETIRIRQMGYSHRLTFLDFLKRYRFLGFSFNARIAPNRENCKLLLKRLRIEGYALGKSKVFLKYYHVEYLSRQYEMQIARIVRVQAQCRRWLAMRLARKLREKASAKIQVMHPCSTEDLRKAVAKKATPCSGQCSAANNCSSKQCTSSKARTEPALSIPSLVSLADNTPRQTSVGLPPASVMPTKDRLVVKVQAPVPSVTVAATGTTLASGSSLPGSNSSQVQGAPSRTLLTLPMTLYRARFILKRSLNRTFTPMLTQLQLHIVHRAVRVEASFQARSSTGKRTEASSLVEAGVAFLIFVRYCAGPRSRLLRRCDDAKAFCRLAKTVIRKSSRSYRLNSSKRVHDQDLREETCVL
ncbi:myosin-IIIb-like isoform X3 [Varroa jacobsoni]|uniref:myosin-IIIb-like isoform X3 n=1 Tax=Varroa jacobsoni TaxID=62625 RepID=UPI000BF6282F|nr:myosin-IIIb-like isoform X3 [Varroa jacobsoni]